MGFGENGEVVGGFDCGVKDFSVVGGFNVEDFADALGVETVEFVEEGVCEGC